MLEDPAGHQQAAQAGSTSGAAPRPRFQQATYGSRSASWCGSGSLISATSPATHCPPAKVFDPQTNAWTALAPMSTARNAFAMMAVQGKLYVAGGYDGSATLATAEAFDPQQNRWEAVAPMAQARRSCAVAAL